MHFSTKKSSLFPFASQRNKVSVKFLHMHCFQHIQDVYLIAFIRILHNTSHNTIKILIQLLQPPVNSKKRDIMMRFKWLLHCRAKKLFNYSTRTLVSRGNRLKLKVSHEIFTAFIALHTCF